MGISVVNCKSPDNRSFVGWPFGRRLPLRSRGPAFPHHLDKKGEKVHHRDFEGNWRQVKR